MLVPLQTENGAVALANQRVSAQSLSPRRTARAAMAVVPPHAGMYEYGVVGIRREQLRR